MDQILPIITQNQSQYDGFYNEIENVNTTLNNAIQPSQNVPTLLKNAQTVLKIKHNVNLDVHQRFEVASDTSRVWMVIRGQMPAIAWVIIYNLIIKDKLATLTSNCDHMVFHSYLLLGLRIAETPDAINGRLPAEMQRLVKRAPLHL